MAEKFGALGGPSIETLLIEYALRCSKTADNADTTDAYNTARMNRTECLETLKLAISRDGQRHSLVTQLIAEHDRAVEAGRK